jgi:hypothetical protein
MQDDLYDFRRIQREIEQSQQEAPAPTSVSSNAANTVYSSGLENLMKTGTSQIGMDPSYDNRFRGGQQAVERSQAAKGFWGSGNMATALEDYGQKAASDEYQAQFSRLASIASLPYDLQGQDIQNQMLSRENTTAQQGFNANQYKLEQRANAGQLQPLYAQGYERSMFDNAAGPGPVKGYTSTPSTVEQIAQRRRELGLV